MDIWSFTRKAPTQRHFCQMPPATSPLHPRPLSQPPSLPSSPLDPFLHSYPLKLPFYPPKSLSRHLMLPLAMTAPLTQAWLTGGIKKPKRKTIRYLYVLGRPLQFPPQPIGPRSYDVYLAYHGKKVSLLRFVNWLQAELEAQGISCFACGRARCRSSRSQSHVEKIMNFTTFGNPCTIEELRHFFSRRNLVPIYFDLGPSDCLARDIVERRRDMWEKHGGELWVLYGGLEREWREAVEALSWAFDLQLEVGCGNWRDYILEAVSVLEKKLGRRSVVDRINRWSEKIKKEEFPCPRNENFVGRKKEISELELILFGDVSEDGTLS